MSFVRTKDGVYDLSNKYSQTPEEVQIALMTGNYKQADTIEELCDEFVFDSDISSYVIDKKHIEHVKTTILKIYKENDENDYVKAMHPKFYGAVWCEFGLKYVAKLNDKGELELI